MSNLNVATIALLHLASTLWAVKAMVSYIGSNPTMLHVIASVGFFVAAVSFTVGMRKW